MRKLGVAAASAALVGTIAAVMPAGIAHADAVGAQLPDPIAGVCSSLDQSGCWRYTSLSDAGGGTLGPLPTASGNILQLTGADTPGLANAAWYNTPIDITGKSIEASFTAFLDSAGPPPGLNPAHGDGLAFALIEGHLPESDVGNNQPAPVPFPANGITNVEFGAAGNGLGFSGFDGNTGNENGRENLGVVLTTSADDANVGGDTLYNASRVGLLRGQRWPDAMHPLPAGQVEQDPHIRSLGTTASNRWYTGSPKDVTPSIYGATANSRPVQVGVQLKSAGAGVWHAKLYVDGALQTESDVNLPNVVFFGFTAGTNEAMLPPQRHAISNVSIRYGTIGAPTVSASPNPVDFGTVGTGLSATKTVTLTNNSAVPVTLGAPSVSAGFSATNVPTTLASGASATAQVKFSPTAEGVANGTLSFSVTNADGSSTTSVALTGTGAVGAAGEGTPYTAVPPTRILDTRPNNGVGPDGTKSVKVTGVGGVPANADAVIMNVTVTEPTADGFITVYPTGTARPTASNLNFVAGQNIANLVTAKVGTGGQVNIYNFAGNTHVLFDVVGYFPAGGGATSLSANAAQGGEFVPLSPARVLDTRSGSGPLGPNSSLDLQVTGNGGVPATGVAAVVMNVTGTNTTAPGFLTAWPTGQARQTTSTLNFVAGQSVPNLAVVPIGTGGKVSIYNFDGNTDVIADVVGYYTAAGVTVPGGGLFHAMSPLRFLDTRPEADNKTLEDGGTVTTPIVGVAGIPAEAVGVVANVTATNTTVPGFLTVFPAGSAVPGTSSLNFTGHEPGVPTLVMSKLGSGAIDIFNFSPGGTTDAIVDVVGWYGPA